MAKANSHQAGREGGRVFVHSQSGTGPSQLPGESDFARYPENGRIVQCFQSPTRPCEMKAMDVSHSHCVDYSGMDVVILEAKLQSDNLRLKKPESRVADMSVHGSNETNMSDSHHRDYSNMDEFMPEVTLKGDNVRLKKMPESRMAAIADVSAHCSSALDIDKKLATKKVIPPAETKDETPPVVDPSLNIQHKKRPLKRLIDQTLYKPSASCAISPEILKITEDTIQQIKAGSANKVEVCRNYNRQYFSNKHNLTAVPDTKVTSGTYGVVSKVKDSQTGSNLIVKQVKKNPGSVFELEKNEVEVPLQFADVENIAKFFGLYWEGDTLLFIMEDAGISLRQLITDRDGCRLLLEPDRIEKIMLDVYTAIRHLASHNITHCDIKPENVCVNTKTWVAKLVDFGSCKTPQDNIDYKGITPEYLDPVANKCLRQVHELKKIPNTAHKLNEKDDVFATGLVGLFLLKKMHPLIHFFTGQDMVMDIETRLKIMEKISEMTERQMSQLLDVPMSGVMRELLHGVLALDRDKRWTSRRAVNFLQENLGSDVQPPHKLSRQAPQPCSTQTQDLAMYVNLQKKNSDKVVAQNIQKCESPGSPDIFENQGLGVMLKGPAASTQTGGILLPAKLSVQRQMMLPLRQLNPQPQYLGQVQQRTPSECTLNENENQEYNDLVKSFNNKTQVGQSRLPAQQTQCFAGVQLRQVLPVPAGRSQAMMLPNPQAGQPVSVNLGAVQGQLAAGPILGLSGNHLFQIAGRSHLNTSSEVHGNIPNIDDLMPSSQEPYRPKLKGRRSHGSQDEK